MRQHRVDRTPSFPSSLVAFVCCATLSRGIYTAHCTVHNKNKSPPTSAIAAHAEANKNDDNNDGAAPPTPRQLHAYNTSLPLLYNNATARLRYAKNKILLLLLDVAARTGLRITLSQHRNDNSTLPQRTQLNLSLNRTQQNRTRGLPARGQGCQALLGGGGLLLPAIH